MHYVSFGRRREIQRPTVAALMHNAAMATPRAAQTDYSPLATEK